MALLRDTKARARRIDLSYFARPHPFRRWRSLLSIALPVVAAAWVAAMAARGDEHAYNSGGMSARHAMLESNCAACHTTAWGQRYTDPAAWQESLDRACLRCHDGPVHHLNAAGLVRGTKGRETASRCSSCHIEHESRAKLADVRDMNCIACHADLKTAGPGSHPATCPAGADHAIHARIEGFERGHPEFAAVARKKADPTVVSFNHAVHLQPDTAQKRELIRTQLKALSGRAGIEAAADGTLQLSCSYCHPSAPGGAYRAPVLYETHCRDCHPLKLKDAPVPHVAPDAVRDFLRSRLAKGGAGGDALAGQVTEAEVPLYTSDPDGCMKCHKTDLGDKFPDVPPVVARTGLRPGLPGREGTPRRWFVHAVFNHETHRELRCTECHAARESKLTADLLMPSRAACLKCHSAAGGVSTACATCHTFHDKARERTSEGTLRIGDVVK